MLLQTAFRAGFRCSEGGGQILTHNPNVLRSECSGIPAENIFLRPWCKMGFLREAFFISGFNDIQGGFNVNRRSYSRKFARNVGKMFTYSAYSHNIGPQITLERSFSRYLREK